jgi:hypothetical protein
VRASPELAPLLVFLLQRWTDQGLQRPRRRRGHRRGDEPATHIPAETLPRVRSRPTSGGPVTWRPTSRAWSPRPATTTRSTTSGPGGRSRRTSRRSTFRDCCWTPLRSASSAPISMSWSTSSRTTTTTTTRALSACTAVTGPPGRRRRACGTCSSCCRPRRRPSRGTSGSPYAPTTGRTCARCCSATRTGTGSPSGGRCPSTGPCPRPRHTARIASASAPQTGGSV